MDGHRPVAVPGTAGDPARRGRCLWVMDRDNQLDQTLPEPQTVHHLDTYVLHRDVAFMHETEHIAIKGQHSRALRSDDTQIDRILRNFDSHRNPLLTLSTRPRPWCACYHNRALRYSNGCLHRIEVEV